MTALKSFLNFLVFFIFISVIISCGGDEVAEVREYFNVTIDGDSLATSAQFSEAEENDFFDAYIIRGSNSPFGDRIVIRLDNEDGTPVFTGANFDMGSDSGNSISYSISDNEWESDNYNGTGTLEITNYTPSGAFNFLEGNFEGVLLSLFDSTSVEVRGEFGVLEL